MPFCATCGKATSTGAAFCPSCGAAVAGPAQPAKKKTSGCVMILAVMFGLVLLLIVVSILMSPVHTPRPTDIATDDAELLILRCGQPTKDNSTAYDDPRPPIPSRTVEYDKQKLRFLFIPGGDAKVGDPPPYHWKFVGVTDMWAADPSKARVVPIPEVVKRMPCWAAGH
jgi:hypothetical protein